MKTDKLARVAWIIGLGSFAVAAAAQPRSCRATLGPDASEVLVDRCLNVSPATHPPCNASNPCSLIRGEIERGCAMLPTGKPDYCSPPAPAR